MKLRFLVLRYLVFACFLFMVSFTLKAQSIEGDWYGKANIQGIELRISVHVKSADQGFTSTFDSPDQGAMGVPCTSTTFSYPDFSFSHAGAGFKYTGAVNAAYTQIEGVLEQGNLKLPITFGRKPVGPPAGSPELYTKQEVYITMRDGVRLFTSIYTPKDSSVKHPILINRTPYDIEPGGPDRFNNILMVYSRYTEKNYILVFQDVRGCFMSEGTFEDIRPVIPVKTGNKDIDETTDTWDTVDWLVKNVSGNNGNVGIFGISYPGFYSTMGLINAHPAVKAVSPQAPVTAWFLGDDVHHNGAFFLLDEFHFDYFFGYPRHGLTRKSNESFKWPIPDSYEFFLSAGPIKNLSKKYLGDSLKFWNETFLHPDYDDFWKARDPRPFLKNVTPAVMTVGGWFDAEDLYGTLHTYDAIEKQNSQSLKNTLVMGPWTHGQWAYGNAENVGNIYWGLDANAKFLKQEADFFNFYLEGKGSLNIPEATIFVTGSNEWREFDKWPPKNSVEKKLYLCPGGIASFTGSDESKSYDEYVSDPMKPVPYIEDVHDTRLARYMTDDQRFAARRPDVMVYQTDVLSEDVTFTGPLKADLFVSTTGTDADFVVKLVDVFPADMHAGKNQEIDVPLGGYQMLVRGEVFRGKYRNSFEKPEPFIPGKIYEVKYAIPDVAHTFKKGHRIMIQVQNSWFPLVDRNPQKFVDIYKCSESDFQKATQRIYHNKDFPSGLVVTVLQ